jgi:hypothetical protein
MERHHTYCEPMAGGAEAHGVLQPCGFQGAGFDLSSAVDSPSPESSSHRLTKLQNSRQLLLTPQLPRVSFEW